jgi:hypothetical protein
VEAAADDTGLIGSAIVGGRESQPRLVKNCRNRPDSEQRACNQRLAASRFFHRFSSVCCGFRVLAASMTLEMSLTAEAFEQCLTDVIQKISSEKRSTDRVVSRLHELCGLIRSIER